MSEKPTNVSGLVTCNLCEITDADALDTLFEIFADRRRRYVLDCLQEHETPLALADVADEVAARETGSPITETSAEEVKRIYVSLYHNHVPKLENAGFVHYCQERDLVTLSEEVPDLEGFEATVS